MPTEPMLRITRCIKGGFVGWANHERMHHYQRERTSITELRVKLREIIETKRLVGEVMTRLVLRAYARNKLVSSL